MARHRMSFFFQYIPKVSFIPFVPPTTIFSYGEFFEPS